MNEDLGKLSYKLVTGSLKMPVFSLFREFERVERMSKDQLKAYQWEKIQRLINYAFRYSPYYKNLFKKLGAEPCDITDEGLYSKIPVLTKDIIREYASDILVRPRPKYLNKAKTSGSTGQPTVIFKDPLGRASTYAAMYRGHFWHGVGVGAKEARLWSVPTGILSKGRIKIKDMVLNRFRQNKSETNESTFEDFLKKMKRYTPRYLMGYPSLIYPFAKYIEHLDADVKSLKLSFIKCTAEVIFDYQKEKIEEIFACPCISEYGATESGVIAFECPHRSQHVMDHCNFVEFIEDETNGSNSYSKIITTNLHNLCFPIIRYDIGDLCTPDNGICDCGRSLPLIKNIIGRTHDIIIGINGERFHSSILSISLKELISYGLNFKQMKFVQNEKGKIQIKIIDTGNLSTLHMELIQKRIQSQFKGCIKVEIEKVQNIPREISGKFGYFASNLNL